MEFKIKAGPQGHYYLPKIVREALGQELCLVPNTKTGVIYSRGADLRDVIKSVRIILADLRLQAEREAREERQHG